MGKLGFLRDGPDDVWTIQESPSGAYVTSNEPSTIRWNDGTSHLFGGAVGVYPALLTRPDLSTNMIFIIFVLQGDTQPWCTTIDNAVLDALVGSATWGIVGWLDETGVHDWQQY